MSLYTAKRPQAPSRVCRLAPAAKDAGAARGGRAGTRRVPRAAPAHRAPGLLPPRRARGNREDRARLRANLAEHLVRARRAELIPFEFIRDDGVVTYSEPCHRDPDDFWDATARRMRDYRRDRQAGQRMRLELWCEAAGMAPQLARVAESYSVPVYSSGGYLSLTAVRLIAGRALEREVPTVLLHVGDLDPSGESIFDALAADAAAFVERDRVILPQRIEAVRIALTRAQVAEHALPTAPVKTSDTRSRAWHGGTCQLEALPPDVLAAIVRRVIEDRLERDVYEREVELENADRHEIALGLPRGGE